MVQPAGETDGGPAGDGPGRGRSACRHAQAGRRLRRGRYPSGGVRRLADPHPLDIQTFLHALESSDLPQPSHCLDSKRDLPSPLSPSILTPRAVSRVIKKGITRPSSAPNGHSGI